MSIALLIALTAVLGALVGLGTELTLKSREKAHRRFGGSLFIGLLCGALLGAPGDGLVSLLVGGASGFAGWLLYCFLAPIGEAK